MKNLFSSSAAGLRIALSGVLILTLALIGGGFYFAQHTLRSYAQETSILNSQANASTQNLSTLRALEQYLKEHDSDLKRASDVVAESNQYKYQDEIVSDISSFAASSGVTVTSFAFSTATQTTPATPATPLVPGATPTTVPVSVTPTTATVTLAQPIKYKNLLNFIHKIEQNVTRMQIASISLTRSDGGGDGSVSVNALNIEVYLRQ